MLNDPTPEQIKERQKLVLDHWPYVRSLARQLKARLPSARMDDLIADGLYGLTLAGERFNPSRGVAFSAFARKFIRGQMLLAFRREDRRRDKTAGAYADDCEGAVERAAKSRELPPETQAELNEGVGLVLANLGDRAGKQTHPDLKMVTIAKRLGISDRAATSRLRKARSIAAEIRADPSSLN